MTKQQIEAIKKLIRYRKVRMRFNPEPGRCVEENDIRASINYIFVNLSHICLGYGKTRAEAREELLALIENLPPQFHKAILGSK